MDESTAYGIDFRTSQPWLSPTISLSFGIGGITALLTLVARLVMRRSEAGVKLDDSRIAYMLRVVARSPRLDLIYMAEVARLLSHGFAETSIALLYLHISPLKRQTHAGRVKIVVIIIYTVFILGLLIRRASGDGFTEPIRPNEGTAHSPQLPMAATVAGIITGLILVLLPVLDISRLHMKPIVKLRALLLWCTPIVGIVVSSVRRFFIASLSSSSDLAMHAAVAMVLMFAEVNLTVICGDFPATCQVIQKIKNKASSETMTGLRSRVGGGSSHAPGEFDEHPLPSPWTEDDDDSSQRGILPTNLFTV
ncbi:hypothetical protein BDP55DRAFT_637778 [Colletotrichum godetiae]|uniref:Rhodopsin domain-containing protein n=1 Tax=Colletotrichum godetiae TaxID=1209918 RepID=A0AAJ0ABJ2_9PEZI|nr:uncharacterized protein BDP55DRAFT_637778 [Colletotrichum godetiae]KAK1658556.1 hypothetical protein BDP55DRAFT_637778 [Colletotrichum godetiae]